jgi:hypothetical protein
VPADPASSPRGWEPSEELEYARRLLIFADGLAVANTGFALADLYAEDCSWAQETLRSAGCHPRGAIPELRDLANTRVQECPQAGCSEPLRSHTHLSPGPGQPVVVVYYDEHLRNPSSEGSV